MSRILMATPAMSKLVINHKHNTVASSTHMVNFLGMNCIISIDFVLKFLCLYVGSQTTSTN